MNYRNVWILGGIFCLLSMTGCTSITGHSGEEVPFDEEALSRELSAEGTARSDGRLTVGFSQIGSESDWRMACTSSVQEAFSTDNGYNFIFSDGQQKQENQLKAIREFIDQDVDYILLDPITETGWDSALQEAQDAGIPVIICDRDVEVADETLYTAWIGSDFELEGERACDWLRQYLERENITESVNIVHIQGTLGASAQIGRTKALETAVRMNENWNLLAQDSGDFTTAKGREVMEEMLRRYGSEIDIVYCENDNEAYGAMDAIEAYGLEVGPDIEAGEILVMSFDTTTRGLEHTLSRRIAVNTECSPLYGPRLVELITRLEAGEEIAHRTYIEEEQFSAIYGIDTTVVDHHAYEVTHLTQEIIDGRSY